jgi:hypothetical protein
VTGPHLLAVLCAAALLPAVSASTDAPQPQTVNAWDAYVAATEGRIAGELASARGFLASDFTPDAADVRARLLRGELVVDGMTARAGGKPIDIPDGLVSHWRGGLFFPRLTVETLLQRLQHPPEHGPFPPDVLALRVLQRTPDALTLFIRMTRRKLVTVTYDTEHQVAYRRHGADRASSRSVATRIVEVEDGGAAAVDRGYLWRLNAYWRYEQIAGGVIVELESLALSRAVPFGLSAFVRPIVDRIAGESVGRTLDGVRQVYGAPVPETPPSAR